MASLDVICFETAAFYALIDEVVARVKPVGAAAKDDWITGAEAMRMLNVKSKTTMQALRDNGKIKFSQPQRKIILYFRPSIDAYLEANAKHTF